MNMTMISMNFSDLPRSPDLNPVDHLWDVVERERASGESSDVMGCNGVNMDQNLKGRFP